MDLKELEKVIAGQLSSLNPALSQPSEAMDRQYISFDAAVFKAKM